ncbi:MAG: hypothetical protein AABX93_01655 [Nanoarchaeota archaeon]
MAKKRGKIRHSRSRSKGYGSSSSQKKVGMILGNLVLSAILFIASIGLYYLISNEVLRNFFWMLGLIFGFVALAFLLVYIIFVVKKILKK